MKEQLSIMQMIAEEKAIKKKIYDMIMSDDFKLVTYYQKNRPFIGARSAEEQEKDQREKLQTLNDLLKRFYAIKKAHTKANRETMVIVPEEITLFDIIQGKTLGNEQITIAEAINRKNTYRSKYINGDIDIYVIASKLLTNYSRYFNMKSSYDEKAKKEIEDQLSRRFPIDSKNNWSQGRYMETKKQLEAETEVVRIDPYNLIENNAIQKFVDVINKYLLEIDVIISQANASTIVEFEY